MEETMDKKLTNRMKYAFIIVCLLVIGGTFIYSIFELYKKIEESNAKELKPLRNMTTEEATFYTDGFGQGYKACLLDVMKVAIDEDGDATAIMNHLNKTSKSMR